MIELPNLRPETRYGMPADQVESRAGLTLWDRLKGEKIDESEAKAGNMWEY